ncbi:EF-hand domain-containing family member B-like [Cydia pomonella]|uniref:EF-hand domain-containing family member B-like n=1 Tax=Cydia pomonella TaxID=82600 RepID=UPI002ADD74AE|nr:EF-hand domain-containing family member B-like [Cydia pomonella]
MPIDCQRSTSGGKGNIGMFIERDPKVCAAGIPTAQPDDKVSDSLQHYLLKEEADALLSDAIHPPQPPKPLPPLRHPPKLDMRNACNGLVSQLVNPPPNTKYQVIADNLKDTVYSSYWTKTLAQSKDPVPMLPEGFDIEGTTFGKKTKYHGSLYDIVMPKVPLPDKTPRAKQLAIQTDRNYCRPPYNPNLTYGHRTGVDKRGRHARCCLTDDKIKIGTSGRDIINSVLADYQTFSKPILGEALTPYNNINEVPQGHAFGKIGRPDSVAECLTNCKINPEKQYFKKCFNHLNKLRKMLSTRYLPTFFGNFYLGLKFFDKERTGWLPKEVVYNYAGTKFIRFDSSLIEPLLLLWNAFDGQQIEYKTFVRALNYRIPSAETPKLPDFPDACIDYRTTYTEMVKPDQPPDCSPMAGVPSGRYFDLDFPITPDYYSKAARNCLPHETDMKACINPSVMTLFHVNHRDMYAKREPGVIRRVFEKIGEQFTDESFNQIWEEAKKYHSEGWVCFETFRRALEAERPCSKD